MLAAMRRLLLALVAGCFGLIPSVVSADIAPPSVEDMQCQRGAVPFLPEVEEGATDPLGRPARPWPYCTPSTCASDDECSDGRVCSDDEIGFCVETQGEGDSARRTIRPRGCEPDGTCLNVNSECETSRRCVDAGARAPEATEEPAAEGAEEPAEESAEEPADEPAEQTEAPAASTDGGGCGCRVGGFVGHTPWGLALLGLALWRRRR